MEEIWMQNFLRYFSQGSRIVVECLHKSAQDSAESSVKARAMLDQMESLPGFCCILLDIYYHHATVDNIASFLAITLCKNVVCRRWQPKEGVCIEETEKRVIKQKIEIILNDCEDLPHPIKFAVLIRRICRTEFPLRWSSLAERLLLNIQRTEDHSALVKKIQFTSRQLNSLFCLNYVIKEQCSKRLPGDKSSSFQLGIHFLEWLGPIWKNIFDDILRQKQNLCYFQCWKFSRYLDELVLYILAFCIEKVHKLPLALQLVDKFFEKTQLLIATFISASFNGFDPFFAKNVKSNLKCFPFLLENQPYSLAYTNFSDMLVSTLELIKCGSSRQDIPDYVIQRCLTLLIMGFRSNSRWNESLPQGYSICDLDGEQRIAERSHSQFTQFVQLVNGVISLGENILLFCIKLSTPQIEAWMSEQDETIEEPIFKRDLRKASKALLEELHQKPYAELIIPHVIHRLAEVTAAYIASIPCNNDAPSSSSMELCSYCDALLSWAVLILKTAVDADAVFSDLILFLCELGKSNAHPLLQFRVLTVIKKALNYGAIPKFEVPKVFNIIKRSIASASLIVQRAAVDPLRVLYRKFVEDDIWLDSQSIDGILFNLTQLLFQLNQPEACYRCLEVIRDLLCCSSNIVPIVGIFAQNHWFVQQFWHLHHQNICEELVNIINTFLLRYDPSNMESVSNFRWVFEYCSFVLSDFVWVTAQNISALKNDSEKSFFKKIFGMWIAYLRVLPLEIIDKEKFKTMREMFSSLLEHCLALVDLFSPDIGQRVIEVIIEYCVLFVTVGLPSTPNVSPQSVCVGFEKFGVIREFSLKLSAILRDGFAGFKSHWIVRRCLHVLLFILYFGFDSIPCEIQTEYLEPLLFWYMELSEMRRCGSTLTERTSLELLKYTPEHFLPPLCCWILKFPSQFGSTKIKTTSEEIESNQRLLFCLFDSFQKVQCTLQRVSILLCEFFLLNLVKHAVSLAKIVLPTLLEQLDSILALLSEEGINCQKVTSMDNYVNYFRGSIHQGMKMPAASRFYVVFKLAITHPQIPLSLNTLDSIKGSVELAVCQFLNYAHGALANANALDISELVQQIENAPVRVKSFFKDSST